MPSAVPYRDTGVALLRSAVATPADMPDHWPDPADTRACASWLDRAWSVPRVAEAIGQASPTLANRVRSIRTGRVTDPKDIRRATVATARYLLRATGRPTPFGLFAGVAPVALGNDAAVRWGDGHRPVVRADTQWLADVIDQLEAVPELLDEVEVVVTNLAVRRGGWLEVPRVPHRVRVPHTAAVRAMRETAGTPVRFGVLAEKLAAIFDSGSAVARSMLAELVRHGVLITSARAPLTVTDPLGYLVDRLRAAGPDRLAVVPELKSIRGQIRRHNQRSPAAGTRVSLTRAMRRVSAAGRVPLAVDLRLDCDVRLPERVARDVERAAGVLLRLAREPGGSPVWRAYHGAFVDRYGVGTLVPVAEVVDPDAGLGFPATYPGSVLPAPADVPSERDQRLLALAWRVVAERGNELVLTDRTLRSIQGEPTGDTRANPPHVEVAVRVHATSTCALVEGDYTLRITPARAGGVLTSRFTPTTTGTGLEPVYRTLPTAVADALPVQMSFPPAHPHAENICRVPAYLPHLLSLGEHRGANDEYTVIGPDDVAVTATADRLYLVSLSRRRVLEPRVFHALALDKQPPPLARFLAHLDGGFTHGWTAFDWGPCAENLPYLPRVRHGRAVLAPARWRLTGHDLPGRARDPEWRQDLAAWRERWNCPARVELCDDDRSLRLDLDEPLHAAILRSHLARHDQALLTESPDDAGLGWIDGHAHEVVLPLVSTRPAAPAPPIAALPVVTNADHCQIPGSPASRWLYARLPAHPERHEEIIATHLPALAADLGEGAEYWFVRYRSPHQTDHLRVRVRVPGPTRFAECARTVGAWADRLRRDGLIGELVFDTYRPEVGRYGTGAALAAAEDVFVADSAVVTAQSRKVSGIDPIALTAGNMIAIVADFLGRDAAEDWLISRPVPARPATRAVADQAIDLASRLAATSAPGEPWPPSVAAAWRTRSDALVRYHTRLRPDADRAAVLESLLHMHHNRARGIDRDGEATCRHLARRAALAARARRAGAGR